MEFTEVVNRRRTVWDWSDKEVDYEAIKRIIEAGMKAPSCDHKRDWQFIILHSKEEKEKAFAYAKKIADNFDQKKYDWDKLDLGMKMYVGEMPKEFTMLTECPYVIVPLFKCKKLGAEWVSKLNPFATIWCVVENMLLAAVNEGLACSLRIPLNKEHDIVLNELEVPEGWMTPCFIGVGYPREGVRLPEQYKVTLENNLHMGKW